MFAEAQDLFVLEKLFDWGRGRKLISEKLALHGQIIVEHLVVLVQAGRDTENRFDSSRGGDVIEMCVGVENVFRL